MHVPPELWEQLSKEQWVCKPCDAVNLGLRRLCRFCKQPRPELAALRGEQA
jgi:hypothetical protein